MSYHNNSASSGSGGSGGNTYTTDSFIKEKDGVVAPLGFHYMDDGRLMSDAEHIRLHGYTEKKITNFNIDTKDINYVGETRRFAVMGHNGAVFSLEVHDDAAGSSTLAPNYYNFDTQTWGSSKTGLYNVELTGSYEFPIIFPQIEFTDATCDYNNDPTIAHDDDNGKIVAGMTVTGTGIPTGATVSSVTSDTAFELSASTTGGAVTNGTLTFGGLLKKYTIDLHAKTVDNIKTKHSAYSEVRNLDGTVNLNKSTGSNSDLISKTLYQDVKKNVYLSLIAPALTGASTDVVDGTVSGSNRIIVDELATTLSNMALGDKVTGTGIDAESHVLITGINPDNDNTKEIEVNQSVSVNDGVLINVTPAFAGMTPNGGVSTTGQQAFEISSGGGLKNFFSITCTAPTGRTLSVSRLPTTGDLCAFTTVTFAAAALALPGEDVSSSTYFRWPVTNIAGLSEGMVLDPARRGTGLNTTTPATISKYNLTRTDLKLIERKYYTDVNSTTVNDFYVNGVDFYSNPITAIDRNNIITAQKGNIVFSAQQADALKSDANVRIFAYGAQKIKSLTGMGVSISNVAITPTQVSTTTTAAVSNSVTIPVTETGNISIASTIRGPGIDSSVANPTVLLKTTASGAGNLTASSAQTLESGQTLFFDNASNILTITGIIEISNMAIEDTTIHLDVERFLNAT